MELGAGARVGGGEWGERKVAPESENKSPEKATGCK